MTTITTNSNDRFVMTIPLVVNKSQDQYLLEFSKHSNKLYNYFLTEGLKRYNLYNKYKTKLYSIIKDLPNNKELKSKILNILKDNFFKGFNEIPNYKNYINDRKKTLGSGYFLDTPNYYLTNINIQNLIDDKDWITDNKHISYFKGCKISEYEKNTFPNRTIKRIGSQITKTIVKTISNKLFQKIKNPKSIGFLKFRKGKEIKSIFNSHNNSNLTFYVDKNNYGILNLIDIEIKTDVTIDKMANPKIRECFNIIKDENNICMCSIKHDIIRNERRWFVDVTLKGMPSMTNMPEQKNDVCGLDLGPKNFAITDSTSSTYKSFHELKTKQKEINFLNKKLSNKIPLDIQNSWNSKNKFKRNKYIKSQSYKNTQNKISQIQRKFKIASDIEINKLAKSISVYKHVYMEDVSYKSWQNFYGKSISIFKPAYFKNKLEYFLNRQNNNLTLINCKAALSQYCICGNKHKKELSERIHNCENCGLIIQRDKFSALLAIYTDPITLKIDFTKAKKHIDNFKTAGII